MDQSMRDIQATHLTNDELLRNAEYYLVKHRELPLAYQEELVQRLRYLLDELDNKR